VTRRLPNPESRIGSLSKANQFFLVAYLLIAFSQFLFDSKDRICAKVTENSYNVYVGMEKLAAAISENRENAIVICVSVIDVRTAIDDAEKKLAYGLNVCSQKWRSVNEIKAPLKLLSDQLNCAEL
jgi:hypothetical protein